jgi:hypothetical protein
MSGTTLPALVVRAPSYRRAELQWVSEILLRRRLGVDFSIAAGEGPLVELDAGRGTVCWPDAFFAAADERWLRGGPAATPAGMRWPVPGADWRTPAGFDDVLQLFGHGAFELAPRRIRLPLDLSGSAFFMLSRYEEACEGAPRDRHGRFPAAAAAAMRAGWIHRPCVDEWVELLASALRRFWPDWQPPSPTPEVWVSCDVDLPYSPGVLGAGRALRQAAAHLVRERRPALAAAALVNPLLTRLGWTGLDPYDTFDWMMTANEAVGQRLTFFFICAEGQSEFEGFYRIDEPRIASLVRRIRERGHEVGLHASYASIDDPGLLAGELQRLRAVMGTVGTAGAVGARQHYLRWHAAHTPAQLAAAGVAYDASLGHAEVPGFRCGTCHAFPLFDLERGRALAVEERPLVLMEVSVMSPTYQGLGHGEAARAAMLEIKASCQRFGGRFSLLWHNSALTRVAERQLYRELIAPYPRR